MTLVAATLVVAPGCGLRQLQDENTMLESRVQQLSQDKAALQVQAGDLRQEVEGLEAERDELAIEAERLRERLNTLQRVVGESQRNQAEALLEDLEARVARESELKLEVEALKGRIETLQNEKTLAQTQAQELKERLAALQETLDANNARLEEQRAQIEEVRAERDSARAERDDFRRQVQAAQSDKSEAATQIEELSEQLRDTEKELTAAQRAAEEARAAAVEARSAREAQTRGRTERLENLRASLGSVPGAETLVEDGRMVVRVPSDSLFQRGTVLLSEGGTTILRAVARGLEGQEFSRVLIEGHTDSVPVANMPFIDNWDLAAARASTVTRWFAQETGVPDSKLTATSHAFYEPVADNETADGRRLNRRVEIVVVP